MTYISHEYIWFNDMTSLLTSNWENLQQTLLNMRALLHALLSLHFAAYGRIFEDKRHNLPFHSN